VDEVIEVMKEVGAPLRSDPAFAGRILDELEVAGVERLGESSVVLRCRFKVAPLEQWGVRREYFRRVKAAFDERGIEIPYPHLTLYAGVDKRGHAPEFPLRTADGRRADAAHDQLHS
jgi:small conductance mechanosensitive channel